jgi:palmitoyltransferase
MILNFVKRWGRRLLGEYLYGKIAAVLNYIVYQKNPIVMMIYLLLAVGGFFIYVRVGFAKYIPGPYVGGIHKLIGTAFMLFCYGSFYLACKSNPGIITKGTLKKAI